MNHIFQTYVRMLRSLVCVTAFLSCLLCFTTIDVSAQSGTKTVSGTVLDESGQPVIGAAVVVQGRSSVGTTTDVDGKFSLPGVKSTDVLEVSSLGYAAQTAGVGATSTFNFVLSEDTDYLDEVVVIGYGTTTRRNITSSVSTVKSEAIAGRPVANLQQALQGTAANLIIQTTNFDPTNNSMNISIRGVSTMGNNSPLIVIDGVPQSGTSQMNELNPNDIESVNVLKDAGSAAIYGARSSNGVILITTKQGQKDQTPVVKFGASWGMQNPHILVTPIASYKNSILRNEALVNVGRDPIFSASEIREMYENGDSEPMVNQAMKNALQQNYNISVSGGSKNTTYMLSASMYDQDSNYIGPDYGLTRYNLRSNLTTQWGRWKLGANVSYTRYESKTPTTSGFLFADLVRYPTYWFLRTMDDNGIFYANNYKYGAPSATLGGLVAGGYNKYDNDYLSGTFSADFEIVKGLKFRAILGGEVRNSHRFSDHQTYYVATDSGSTWVDPSTAVISGSTDTPADDWTEKSTYVTSQLMLDFNRTFGNHNVTALFGWSDECSKAYSTSISKTYLDDLNQPGEDTIISTSSNLSSESNSKSALMSYFGRVGYSYAEKYYLEFTARYDMSSKFMKVRNAGFFPAVSAGWRISQENFMGNYNTRVGDLKLRASYGLNGNQYDVGLYDFLTTYGIWQNAYGFNGVSVPGLMFTMGNESLTWETAKTFNVGVDASFFKNSLSVSFDYFYKRTKDILLQPIVPDTYGASIANENRGVMDDQGWELTVNYALKTGDVTHGFDFNIADSKNKVVKYGDMSINSNDGVTVIIKEGEPLNSYYGYKVAGYYKSYEEIENSAILTTIDRSQLRPGDVKYVDQNGDGQIDENDRTILGYGFPRFTYGFTYRLAWKGIDLSIFLQGVMKRTNSIRGEIMEPFHSDYGYTLFEHQMDYWRPDNTDSWLPRLATSGSVSETNNWGQSGSSLTMINGAYLRVKNITLGYTLPEKWTSKIHLKSLRIYADCQNPLTFTKYKFVDPETTEFGSNMSRSGANSARNYPTLRYFGGGVNLTF